MTDSFTLRLQRKNAAYNQGGEAKLNGKTPTANPHPNNRYDTENMYDAWLLGWMHQDEGKFMHDYFGE
jgi:hypothetical protein